MFTPLCVCLLFASVLYYVCVWISPFHSYSLHHSPSFFPSFPHLLCVCVSPFHSYSSLLSLLLPTFPISFPHKLCVCVPPSLPTESVPSQDSFRDDDQVMENMLAGVDPEEDSAHYMAILVESLSTLGRVADALDVRYMLNTSPLYVCI